MNVFVDIETYSGVNLPTQGVHRYVEDKDFEILLVAYAVDDEEPVVFELGESGWSEEEKRFNSLYFSSGRGPDPVVLWSFNAQFERICLGAYMEGAPFRTDDFCIWRPEWRDIQSRAVYNGLPNSLDNCCKALGIDSKNEDGAKLVSIFCGKAAPAPANGWRGRLSKKELPGEWEKFKEYVLQDVRCCREVWRRTDPLPDVEEQVWDLDQLINDRGVPVDVDFVNGAAEIDEVCEDDLRSVLCEATGLDNPKSKTQMKSFCERRLGTPIASLDKAATASLIETTEDESLARILKLQAQLSMSSVAKYKVIKDCLCNDRKVRGLLKYYGANTGRWAGRMVQLQNLPSASLDGIGLARSLVKSRDYDMLKLLYGNVRGCLSGLIRTSFAAPEGYTFIVADYSAIEARVIAWLADESWRQEVFATHGKIYEASASQMFNVPVDEVSKEQRKKGKIAELALGYGGGVNALRAFGADKLGLSDEELKDLVVSWRAKSPKIKALWSSLERVAHYVVETGLGVKIERLELVKREGHLLLKLPSGRALYYREAYFDADKLAYKSRTSMAAHGYGVSRTYGGKLTENVIQAIARDLLASALLRLEAADFITLFHVHDEIICLVPEDQAEAKLKEMIDIMCDTPDWASGLFLKAAGFVSPYYRKD